MRGPVYRHKWQRPRYLRISTLFLFNSCSKIKFLQNSMRCTFGFSSCDVFLFNRLWRDERKRRSLVVNTTALTKIFGFDKIRRSLFGSRKNSSKESIVLKQLSFDLWHAKFYVFSRIFLIRNYLQPILAALIHHFTLILMFLILYQYVHKNLLVTILLFCFHQKISFFEKISFTHRRVKWKFSLCTPFTSANKISVKERKEPKRKLSFAPLNCL